MADLKFSQFTAGGDIAPGDIVVGLRGGINTKFTPTTTSNAMVYAPVDSVSVVDMNATYNNGAAGVGATLICNVNGILTIDGFQPQIGFRVLIAGQTIPPQNGIYVVVDTGSVGTPFNLIRATDFDQATEIVLGGMVPVYDGLDYNSSLWIIGLAPVIMGTDNISLASTMDKALDFFNFMKAADNLSDIGSPLIAFDNISPLNTKGGLVGHTGLASAELAPGTNGYSLLADSAQPLGIKWAPTPSEINFTIKGQLLTYDGVANAYLNAGTNGYCLLADSTQPDGLRWAPGATPSFIYPYTFTGNNVLFDFAPTMSFASANSIIFLDASKNIATASPQAFTYDNANNNLRLAINPGAMSGINNIVLMADTSAINGPYAGVFCVDGVSSIAGNHSIMMGGNNISMLALTSYNSAIGSNGVTFDTLCSNNLSAASTGNFNNFCDHSVMIGSTATIDGSFYASIIASDTASITSGSWSSIVGGKNHILNGAYNFIGGGLTNINNGGASFIGAGTTNSITGTSSNSGMLAGNQNTINNANNAAIVGAFNSSIQSGCHDSIILGGATNAITGGITSVIAGGSNNIVNGEGNFIAAALGTTANNEYCVLLGSDITSTTYHSFVFSDGTTPQTLTIPNSFNIIASRGVAIGGVNPSLFTSIDLKETTKAVRLNNVAGTAAITTPLKGHILLDTTTNQFMGYNGTSWVILG